MTVKFYYHTNCVNSDVDAIPPMTECPSRISLRTFLRRCYYMRRCAIEYIFIPPPHIDLSTYPHAL